MACPDLHRGMEIEDGELGTVASHNLMDERDSDTCVILIQDPCVEHL